MAGGFTGVESFIGGVAVLAPVLAMNVGSIAVLKLVRSHELSAFHRMVANASLLGSFVILITVIAVLLGKGELVREYSGLLLFIAVLVPCSLVLNVVRLAFQTSSRNTDN